MKKGSLVHYDPGSDVLYIVVRKGKEEELVEIAPGINVELDDAGKVIGIEILRASKVLEPIAKPLYQQIELAKV